MVRAVRSTLHALPYSSELIVVNDASTDRTLQAISSIGDSRLRVINSQGRGLVSALNTGIEASQGEFIARMDADDVCLPWRFSLQLKTMRSSPEIDFLFSTAVAFGSSLSPLFFMPQLPWPLSVDDFKKVLARRNPAVHPTMISRASSLKALGGYRDCPAEDEHLWLTAALNGQKLARAGLPVIALRLHGAQRTRQKGWQDASVRDRTIPALRRILGENLGPSEGTDSLPFKLFDFLDSNGFSSFRIFASLVKSRVLRRVKGGSNRS